MNTPREDAIALLLNFVDYDFVVHDNLSEWIQEEYEDYDEDHADKMRDECLDILEQVRTYIQGLDQE